MATRLTVCTALVVFVAPVASGAAAELKPQTAAAFDRYVQLSERRMDEEVGRAGAFLFTERMEAAGRRDADRRVRNGEVLIERLRTRDGNRAIDVPDGLIHHWVGLGFLPGVRLDAAVALLQDYDRHAQVYRPNVVASRILSREGSSFRVYLRFFMKKVIAVTLNTEHDARFSRLGPDRAQSRIHSTRIAEVADAGTPAEREKPPGRDTGFMWRLNTYWRFLERDDGTYIQCESITLSRDIPFGLGWIVGPFVTEIPRESLKFTMERTRQELLKAARSAGGPLSSRADALRERGALGRSRTRRPLMGERAGFAGAVPQQLFQLATELPRVLCDAPNLRPEPVFAVGHNWHWCRRSVRFPTYKRVHLRKSMIDAVRRW